MALKTSHERESRSKRFDRGEQLSGFYRLPAIARSFSPGGLTVELCVCQVEVDVATTCLYRWLLRIRVHERLVVRCHRQQLRSCVVSAVRADRGRPDPRRDAASLQQLGSNRHVGDHGQVLARRGPACLTTRRCRRLPSITSLLKSPLIAAGDAVDLAHDLAARLDDEALSPSHTVIVRWRKFSSEALAISAASCWVQLAAQRPGSGIAPPGHRWPPPDAAVPIAGRTWRRRWRTVRQTDSRPAAPSRPAERSE